MAVKEYQLNRYKSLGVEPVRRRPGMYTDTARPPLGARGGGQQR